MKSAKEINARIEELTKKRIAITNPLETRTTKKGSKVYKSNVVPQKSDAQEAADRVAVDKINAEIEGLKWVLEEEKA